MDGNSGPAGIRKDPRRAGSLVMRLSSRSLKASSAGDGEKSAATMVELLSGNKRQQHQDQQIVEAKSVLAKLHKTVNKKDQEGLKDDRGNSMNAFVESQRKVRKYEDKIWKAKATKSAVVIQKHVRRMIVRSQLPQRCHHFKTERIAVARSALHGFEFSEPKYRIESYKVLIRILDGDLTFQDILNEVIDCDVLRSIHNDLFARSRTLRQRAVQFLSLFAHNHRGNQRLVCGLNGISVGNIRLVAVSARFEKQYYEWCVRHRLQTTYEGTIKFIEGVVTTASEYYRNSQHFDKSKVSLRGSVFSYPKAYAYSEIDPHTHLIGINLLPAITTEKLNFQEVNDLHELLALFDRAARSHGDPVTLFDSLVPSVPLYALLTVLRSDLASSTLSDALRDFLGSTQDVVNLGAMGKLEDHLAPEERTVIKVKQELCQKPVGKETITAEILSEAARTGMSVLWPPVAAKYTRHLIERQFHELCCSTGIKSTAHLAEMFAPDACFQGTDSRIKSANALRHAKFVKRLDLVVKVKNLQRKDQARHLLQSRLLPPGMSDALFLWDLLGPLREEDYYQAIDLCWNDHNYADKDDNHNSKQKRKRSGGRNCRKSDIPLPGNGVRVTVQNTSTSVNARETVRNGLGKGECNWDWIGWDEFLITSIAAHRRSLQLPYESATPESVATLRSLPDPNTGAWAPSKVSNTARRVKQLQKMMRASQKLCSSQTSPQELARRACLEHELILLSKALGSVNPILSPAYTCVAKDPEDVDAKTRKTMSGSESLNILADSKEESAHDNDNDNDEEEGFLNNHPHKMLTMSSFHELLDAVEKTQQRDMQRSVVATRMACDAEKRREAARKAVERRARGQERQAKEKNLRAERQLKAEMIFAREKIELELKQTQAAAVQSKRRKQRFIQDKRNLAESRVILRRLKCAEQRQSRPVEDDNISAAEYRSRMAEFDSLTHVRNQLIFNPPHRYDGEEDTEIKAHQLSSKALAAYATQAAPIWALCKEDMQTSPRQYGGAEDTPSSGGALASKSLAVQVQCARVKENYLSRIGGRFFKTKDVQEITEKRFTMDEIRKATVKYSSGAHPLTSRTAVILAKHFFNKRMIKQQLDFMINTHTMDKFLNIMAYLQGNNVERPLPFDKLQTQKSKEHAEEEELIRSFLEQTTRKHRTNVNHNRVSPRPPGHKKSRAAPSPRKTTTVTAPLEL